MASIQGGGRALSSHGCNNGPVSSHTAPVTGLPRPPSASLSPRATVATFLSAYHIYSVRGRRGAEWDSTRRSSASVPIPKHQGQVREPPLWESVCVEHLRPLQRLHAESLKRLRVSFFWCLYVFTSCAFVSHCVCVCLSLSTLPFFHHHSSSNTFTYVFNTSGVLRNCKKDKTWFWRLPLTVTTAAIVQLADLWPLGSAAILFVRWKSQAVL